MSEERRDEGREPAGLNRTAFIESDGLAGALLNGRYQVEREIGRGGFSAVYLARDRQLHSRAVVVKVLLDEAFSNDWVVAKFRQEVEALSRLDHPGVVGIIDVGDLPGGKPFIVMQYVDGVTLRSLMRPEGAPLELAAEVIRQTGRALGAAHDSDVIHRDLKPENIMLRQPADGEVQVKVIDFGIARVKDSLVKPSTETGKLAGTILYMSPEQLSGRTLTPASDVYALGVIACELVAGRRPFNPESAFELLEMQRASVRVRPKDLRPALTEAAERLILKALAFDPKERPPSARAFGDELARALGEWELSGPRPDDARPNPFVTVPSEEASVQTPLAHRPGAPPLKTIAAVSATPAPRGLHGSGAQEGGPRRGLGLPLLALTGLLLLGALAGGLWYALRGGARTADANAGPAGGAANVAASNTAAGVKPDSAATSPAPARSLNYWLTVQKMRDGKPYQDEFDSSGQEIFESGWRFRFNMRSQQGGRLYLLNEGLVEGGRTTLNLLYPSPTANDGSSEVGADEKVQTGWMVFDENQGTEKFWVVWAKEPVGTLEDLKHLVNPRDLGAITDGADARAVRDFLNRHAPSTAAPEKDRAARQLVVKGGDVLVTHVELEHH
jgi:serine/threonine-protein kinase